MRYKEISIADLRNSSIYPVPGKEKGTYFHAIPQNTALIIKNIDTLLDKKNSDGHRNIYFLKEFISTSVYPIIFITDDVYSIDKDLQNTFLFRIFFGYMDNAQKEAAFKLFFDFDAPERLRRLGGLVIEDFSRIKKKAKILGKETCEEIFELLEEEAKFKAGGSDSYLLPDVLFNDTLIKSDTNILDLTSKLSSNPDNPFSMLIYGPPGTGKSYYLRHLAHQLELTTLEKTAADLFSKYQGEPAKNVLKMFNEATEKKAMIILDEADEILMNRANSDNNQSWKKDMVNAFLTNLESFKLPIACTTNFIEKIDPAIMRRFIFKIKFDYLDKEQRKLAFEHFFKLGHDERIYDIENLTNGDFSTVKKQSIILGFSNDADKLIEALKKEVGKKDSNSNSHKIQIGFKLSDD